MIRRVALLPATTLSDPTYARALPSLAAALRRRGWTSKVFRSRRGDAAALDRFRPSVANLHCAGHVDAAALRLARRALRAGAALVVTLQDLGHPELAAAERASASRLSFLMERASAVVALTPSLARQAARRFGGRRPLAIGNGVDARWFQGWTERRGPVTAVGRLCPYKGIDVLLWAFARWAEGRPEARLRIYGRDFHRGHYQRLARRLGLGDRVRFMGCVGRRGLQAALGRASIVVSASRRETYGMALLEAMASGAPLVATRVGVAAELLRHRRSAWLVAPGDPDGLARGLEFVGADRALRERLGREARRAARGQTWADRARRYDAVFREALDG